MCGFSSHDRVTFPAQLEGSAQVCIGFGFTIFTGRENFFNASLVFSLQVVLWRI